MTAIDWTLVVVLNGAIIIYGLFLGRGTKSSADWFLAGRRLPWWIVGLSLYATAIDSSDLVADSGATYNSGIVMFLVSWLGVVGGWMLAAHFVLPPMYRAGMYTNAEYLETRFGPTARLLSALVQVQYRTLVLGIISVTIFLTVSIVFGWSEHAAWWTVIAIAAVATIYTALGGLRSVAVTDALQSIVMLVASFTLFGILWSELGGWSGVEAKLAAHNADLPDRLMRTGAGRPGTPGWLVCIELTVAGLAYSIVNHTQSMRMFGSRSLWDMKMSVVVAGAILLVVTFLNLGMGVFGRALYSELALLPVPESLQKHDSIYPILIRELTSPGFKGIIVAGLFAASFSTFDSIGSTLSSLLTRDVYARFVAPTREDHHYLRVGQWLTPAIIFGSFAYVPFLLEEGMMGFYLKLVGAFVVPLLTIYLMGRFTPVHRKSGTVGIAFGFVYGVVQLASQRADDGFLPDWFVGQSEAYVWSMAITAGAMVAVSIALGWDHEAGRIDSRETVGHGVPERSAALPVALGIAVMVIAVYLSLFAFW